MQDITAIVDTQLCERPVHNRKHGLEYCGPCPWCGGTDRFHVWPDANPIPALGPLGWFLCMGRKQGRAGCGRSGDAISYLQQKHGMSFTQACSKLGIDAQAILAYRSGHQEQPQQGKLTPASFRNLMQAEPCQEWRGTALKLAAWAHAQLGGESLSYVLERGIVQETIQKAHLGYYPAYKWVKARVWGYQGRRLLIPRGIVIPWFDEHMQVVCLRFRRLPGDESNEARRYYGVNEKTGQINRYRVLAGSSSQHLYRGATITLGCCTVLVEGELDALLLAQEVEACRIAVVATGSTGWGRNAQWIGRLATCSRVLVCFDMDDNQAGRKAADYWLSQLHNAQRLCPWWHDAGDMKQDSALQDWLAAIGLKDELQDEVPIEDDEGSVMTTCCMCGANIEDMAHAFRYDAQGRLFCDVHWHESEPEREGQPGITCIAASTFAEHVNSLAAQLDQVEGEPLRLALDLETTGLDVQVERIVSIAFGRPGKVTILDMRPYYALPEAEQAEWRRALRKLLEHPAVTWIGHNLKFDASMLLYHFGVRLHRVYDTMLVEQLLQAGRLSHKGAFSLLETASRYDLAATKEEREWFPGLDRRPAEWRAPFPEQIIAYIIQDIEVPYTVYARQQELIEREGLARVTDLENAMLPALAAMEVHGALIDQERWKAVLRLKRERQAAIEQDLIETLGAARFTSQQTTYQARCKEYEAYQQARSLEEKRLMHTYTTDGQGKSTWKAFHDAGMAEWRAQHPAPPKPEVPTRAMNLASTDHLIEAFMQLGIQVTSTREEVLEEYASRYPVIAQVLEWRKLQHFCSAFGENLLSFTKPDGRIHAHFDQIGAVSGRVICNGPNLQQIPKKREKERNEEDIRRCFIAPPGCRLVKADLSNIELRILAEVSGDPVLLRLFAEGKDLHAETARLIFRLAKEVDTRQHLYNGMAVREIAKTINYGLTYGMGPQRLANRTGMSVEEARGLMHTYFTTYAGVARWLKSAARRAAQQGYVTSLSGRKRVFHFDGLNKAQRAALERSAKNHAIQGTNADILKRALALLYITLPQEVHMILAVHDEIVLECPEDLVEQASQILKDSMVQACRDYLKVVHVPEPDVLVDTYWKKG